jgi:hypothetical protein
MMIRVLTLLSLASLSCAFVGPQQRLGEGAVAPSSSSSLSMAPRFDASINRWIATKPEEEASAGYPVFKTLLLRGPKPFLHRLLQPDDQAVLKFMAGDGVDRVTAQGNMDAYLESTFRLTKSLVAVRGWCHGSNASLTCPVSFATYQIRTIGRSIDLRTRNGALFETTLPSTPPN